jgi:hypothetical protein
LKTADVRNKLFHFSEVWKQGKLVNLLKAWCQALWRGQTTEIAGSSGPGNIVSCFCLFVCFTCFSVTAEHAVFSLGTPTELCNEDICTLLHGYYMLIKSLKIVVKMN